jgi:hypothetical protein
MPSASQENRKDAEDSEGNLESALLKSEPGVYHRGEGPEKELMSLAQTVSTNVNVRTVQLAKALTEVGPDIPEISRRLGQFKESVRYRYKEKILNKGFAVQAAVDHEKLGLKRLILMVDFAESYRNYATTILTAMSELSYVVGFAKALVGTEYVVNVSAPVDLVGEVQEFFLGLKERGMFASVDILEFDWARNVPMRAESYDFDTGRWDFEWQNPSPQSYEAAAYTPSKPGKFDYVDLLIIKELQMDANKSLKEIADNLGINYKKLAWHHATHVGARKLLHGYTINWMGTRYDYAIERALHRKHRYFAVDLFAKDVNEYETMTLRQQMNRLPFLWGEAVGKNYFAELVLPVDYVVEGLQYLGNAASQVRERLTLYPMDQTEAARFTIPYKLYDSSGKRWTFNREQLRRKFDELAVQIKVGSS